MNEYKDRHIPNTITPCHSRDLDDGLWIRADLQGWVDEFARGQFVFECDISDALKFYFDEDGENPAKKITIELKNPWKNLKLYGMDVEFVIED